MKKSTFGIASFIEREFGDCVSHKVLVSVAAKHNLCSLDLIENYKQVVDIRRRLNEFMS